MGLGFRLTFAREDSGHLLGWMLPGRADGAQACLFWRDWELGRGIPDLPLVTVSVGWY
jgi:hypothetical protein